MFPFYFPELCFDCINHKCKFIFYMVHNFILYKWPLVPHGSHKSGLTWFILNYIDISLYKFSCIHVLVGGMLFVLNSIPTSNLAIHFIEFINVFIYSLEFMFRIRVNMHLISFRDRKVSVSYKSHGQMAKESEVKELKLYVGRDILLLV